MANSTSPSAIAFTRDHVNPQALGGGRWVPCCRQCNQLKGALPINAWFWFIDNHPEWWKHFTLHTKVARAVRAESIRRRCKEEPGLYHEGGNDG